MESGRKSSSPRQWRERGFHTSHCPGCHFVSAHILSLFVILRYQKTRGDSNAAGHPCRVGVSALQRRCNSDD